MSNSEQNNIVEQNKIENIKISHGLFANGSSKLIYNNKNIVIAYINGPFEGKSEVSNKLSIETRVRVLNDNSYNRFVEKIINNVVENYIENVDVYKHININVISNFYSIPCILNAVLIALLDGGFPLKEIFYSTGGQNELYVHDKENCKCIYSFSNNSTNNSTNNDIFNDINFTKEIIHSSIKDMF